MYGHWKKSLNFWISLSFFIGISIVFAESQPPSSAPSKPSQPPQNSASQKENAPADEKREYAD